VTELEIAVVVWRPLLVTTERNSRELSIVYENTTDRSDDEPRMTKYYW